MLAGERQTPLDVAQAATYFERALELTPPGRPERGRVSRKATELGWRSGRVDADAAIRAYEEASELALAADDRREAAFAMRRLYFQLGFRGDGAAARANIDRAIDLLDGQEPTPLLAELYACRAEDEMFSGHSESSLRWADRALALPHDDSTAIMTLHIRGNDRCELGDLGGLDDLWLALQRAETTANALHLRSPTRDRHLQEAAAIIREIAASLSLERQAVYLAAPQVAQVLDAID